MRTGQSLESIAKSIERAESSRRDILVRPDAMAVSAPGNYGSTKVAVRSRNVREGLRISSLAHSHISSRAGIPKGYYDRILKSHPGVYEHSVNELLVSQGDERGEQTFMLRATGDRLRAFLSGSFKRLDNADITQLLNVVTSQSEIDVERSSFHIPEHFDMALKIVLGSPHAPGTQSGSSLRFAFFVFNSEFGGGSFEMVPGLITEPGGYPVVELEEHQTRHHAIIPPESPWNESHLGSPKHLEQEAEILPEPDFEPLYQDATEYVRKATGSVSEQLFERLRSEAQGAWSRPLETLCGPGSGPGDIVQDVATETGLRDSEQEDLMDAFEVLEPTHWGLVQALSIAGTKAGSFERSTELEKTAGTILSFDREDWSELDSTELRGDQ